MKKIVIAVAALLSIACEKVIDVDLNSSDPQKVIEANLRNGEDSLMILITETGDYFDDSTPEKIVGAKVNLTTEDGRVLAATMSTPGTYWIDSIGTTSDKSYVLDIESDGKLTTSTSYLPIAVSIDSLYFEYFEGNAFVDEGYRPYIAFQDPPGVENYYHILIFVNGVEENDLIITDDKFTDGEYRELDFFGLELEPQAGDLVEVELRSINADVYEYYSSVNDIIESRGGGQVAPGNPLTNLEGDIQLGYFGTYSFSQAQNIFPD